MLNKMTIQAIKETFQDYGGVVAVVKITLQALAVVAIFVSLWLLLWLGYDAGMTM